MSLINVAIVAVDGFSPFHYSVPCILFGDSVSGEKRFNVTICAETPGFLTSKDGFALNATQDYTAIGQADIVVVPYWQHVLERPPQTLLDSLVQARDNGAEIVGLCLGSFVLAWAGLLDGKRAATHWEFEHQLQSLLPHVQLDIRQYHHLCWNGGCAGLLPVYHSPALWQRGCQPDCPSDDCSALPRRRAGAVHRPAGTQRYPRRTY